MQLLALSDDNVALIGCAVALTFSFGLMSLSYFFGSARTTEQTADTIRFETRSADPAQEQDKTRRAA